MSEPLESAAVVPEPSSNFHQPTRPESAASAGLVHAEPSTKTKDTKKINFLHIVVLLQKKVNIKHIDDWSCTYRLRIARSSGLSTTSFLQQPKNSFQRFGKNPYLQNIRLRRSCRYSPALRGIGKIPRAIQACMRLQNQKPTGTCLYYALYQIRPSRVKQNLAVHALILDCSS